MKEEQIISINIEINVSELLEQLALAEKIEDGEEFFTEFAKVFNAKKQLKDAADSIASIEADAKGLINAKAKQLYGEDWQALKGKTFKITRSRTAAVYVIAGTPQKKFLKVKESVDTDKVEEFMYKNDGKLPSGIELNENRGESIRVAVNEDA